MEVIKLTTRSVIKVNRYLVQDGNDIKSYFVGSWNVIGNTPVTEEMFIDDGMNDLLDINELTIDLLGEDSILLVYDDTNPLSKSIDINFTIKPQLVFQSSIDLSSFVSISNFKLIATNDSPSTIKTIVSTDNGVTWKSYSLGVIVAVDIGDIPDVYEKGMSIDNFNLLVEEDIFALLNGSSSIKFAYLFDIEDINDIVSISEISVTGIMDGVWQISIKDDDYNIVCSNVRLKVSIYNSGSYKVNY